MEGLFMTALRGSFPVEGLVVQGERREEWMFHAVAANA